MTNAGYTEHWTSCILPQCVDAPGTWLCRGWPLWAQVVKLVVKLINPSAASWSLHPLTPGPPPGGDLLEWLLAPSLRLALSFVGSFIHSFSHSGIHSYYR